MTVTPITKTTTYRVRMWAQLDEARCLGQALVANLADARRWATETAAGWASDNQNGRDMWVTVTPGDVPRTAALAQWRPNPTGHIHWAVRTTDGEFGPWLQIPASESTCG